MTRRVSTTNRYDNFTKSKFRLHVGGIGDALLLLSTFYDTKPETTIVSIPNCSAAAKSLFTNFELLSGVHVLDHTTPLNNAIDSVLLNTLTGSANFTGAGVTPIDRNYSREWSPKLNIFTRYGVVQQPKWITQFGNAAPLRYPGPGVARVIVAPTGSTFGMGSCKRNIINPAWWNDVLRIIASYGIRPIMVGTPDECTQYPITSECIDRRGLALRDHLNLIADCDLLVGADSWAKTWAALCNKPVVMFKPLYSGNLAQGYKDPSDYVFVDPWPTIKVVDSVQSFEKTFYKELTHGK